MRTLALIGYLLLAPALAHAQARDVGIVLMHGREGMPNDNVIGGLASRLERAGYRVDMPEMCFSHRRIYDLTYEDCLRDIDASVARLRAAGSRRVVVAGQSQGGVTAIVYGATHDGLAGIIAIAPGGDASRQIHNPNIASAVQQAEASPDPNRKMSFYEINTGGRVFVVSTTPVIYLSFHKLDSLANLMRTTPRLHAPMLWIAGSQDPGQEGEPARTFARAPASPLNRFQVVAAGHLATPDMSTDVILTWLAALP
jgi:esterase/lipase